MNRGELIAALNQVVSQLTDIITALKDQRPPTARAADTICPIHGVPWQKYKFGWAHPPTKAGEKWCKRKK